ncbi:hypothetical protein [Fodinibius sp. AD559]|uniref:hypothetical protein n=1 Tax=Fodinibius sp. AD559 TaxID=3424179 RepID=UPI004046B6FA
MSDRLFHALRKQLEHKVYFVNDVGKPYDDMVNELEIFDFKYKGQQCQLILNGDITLKTQQNEKEIGSYQELVNELRHSASNSRVNS